MTIYIPAAAQTDATHPTANLAGYPAIDMFGELGEAVVMEAAGRVAGAYDNPWHPGFGGHTFYYFTATHGVYFVTHLDEGGAISNGNYPAGTTVGHLTRSALHASYLNKPPGAHVHVGNTTWSGFDYAGRPIHGSGVQGGGNAPPGKSPPANRTPPPKRTAPPTQLPNDVAAPGAQLKRRGNVVANWKNLMLAIGSTLPTQDVHVRHIGHQIRRAVR